MVGRCQGGEHQDRLRKRDAPIPKALRLIKDFSTLND
jgi:hypothetical protein